MRRLLALVLALAPVYAGDVEILRDRWGVPHLYANNTDDVYYAQGYVAAMDRLFQIDLWRRQNTGRMAEILGPEAIPRDRLARLVRYRGDMDAEWKSYGPDTKRIATNFVEGINAYIRSLKGNPIEFQVAGYAPEPWKPEDVLGRVAGLLMTRNLTREVQRAQDIRNFGIADVERYLPLHPSIRLTPPKDLDLALITSDILTGYNAAVAVPQFAIRDRGPGEQGSNNWVVDGTRTATGKPMLANDPHRPVLLPSLRKTWHLVAPGLDVFGAGEPALPGIALGHNNSIAWGFTIVGTDQQDLYVEKLNPQNPGQYLYRGQWRKFEIEHDKIKVKGSADPVDVELRYTVHGPVIHEDRGHHVAFALKWVGAEPGGAGYLGALALLRAKNWTEFLQGVEHYKVPSENLVYADTGGNIGWIAAGYAPVRTNWNGLLPVPGDSGEYEWSGFLPVSQMPQEYNPKRHFIATANHNILPEGYPHTLSFEWALPFRFQRIEEQLSADRKWDRRDFERMQQDVLSLPAQRFQAILRAWTPPEGSRAASIVQQLTAWDAQLRLFSEPALVYELWMSHLPDALFGPKLGPRVDIETVLESLERQPQPKALADSLAAALQELDARFPPGRQKWGVQHTIFFRHPLGLRDWNRGPFPRPGDANTVNATSGAALRQANGASYRQIIDLSDWDRSIMTNVPGEAGTPGSPHYDDLIHDWLDGLYHPMPYTRAAVERETEQRYVLKRGK